MKVNLDIEDNKWQLVNCNLCGSEQFNEICSYGQVKIVKCENCGLIYRNPRLKENMNREFYSYDYYGEYDDIEEKISSARMGIFKNVLSKLQKEISRSSRRLLDVGCGQGHFLKLAKDLGWQIQGVEVARQACDYAKKKFNIDLINKTLEEASFKENSFDAVTLWNVLDHLLDPLGTSKEIRRILKPGGVLVVRVPNARFHLFTHKIFSLLSFILITKKINDPSVITNYGFSKKTIEKILQKGGFREIRVYNSLPTFGDPYRLFKIFKDFVVNFYKGIYFILSEFIYYLTFKKCIIGTSLLVWAKNGGD